MSDTPKPDLETSLSVRPRNDLLPFGWSRLPALIGCPESLRKAAIVHETRIRSSITMVGVDHREASLHHYADQGKESEALQGEEHRTVNRIIVVDDEVVISETLALVLRHSGYQVEAFTSPIQALAALGEHGADVLITDMLMPLMNGFEIAAAACKVCPSCRVLILSGREICESTRMGEQGSSGCEFMMKPVPPEQLLSKLKELPLSSRSPEVVVGTEAEHYSLGPQRHRSCITPPSHLACS